MTQGLPDLYEATIEELQTGLSLGLFTSVDLTRAYLQRIEEANPKLNCVLQCNHKALEEAAAADEARRVIPSLPVRRPLLGIPIALKDNIAARASDGMATTAGSHALAGALASDDAAVVAALREAGAIILAKLSMSEWAYFRAVGELPSGWAGMHGQILGAYGAKANPSGSSGGSAVAASVGLCAAALGTETFGSIVSPSSCNNLVGVRPTIGLVSGRGIIPISSNHDSCGPMARCVSDVAIVLDALTGSTQYRSALRKDALEGKT
jgi:amidase